MSDVTEQVRETFGAVGREVPVPPFDELAFRREVRRARRRRTGRAALGAGVAAAVVTGALLVVPPLVGDGPHGRTEAAGAPGAPTLDPHALPAPLYYTAGGQLVAATPDGEVHDLGRYEAVVGSTAEGVLTVDRDSRPVWIGAASSGEGDGAFTFEPGAGPVVLPATGPVQSVALSGDGRWLAWVDLEDVVTVYDLKAQAKVQHIETDPNSHVTSVSDRGALVSVDGELGLFGRTGVVEVPTAEDGFGWVSDTAGDFVTVADRDDVTRVYDVAKTVQGDTARLVDEVPGTGRLAPYARGIVTVRGSAARLWPTDGEPRVLAGLGGDPQSAGWLDEDYALVTTAEAGGTSVYVCPVAEPSCTPVVWSQEDVRLAE